MQDSESESIVSHTTHTDISSLEKARKYATFAASQAKEGNYSDAVEFYSQAIRKDQSNTDYYLKRGEAQLNDMKYLEARKDADLAIQMVNIEVLQISEAFSLIGRARMALGEFEEAETDFQRALTIASNEGYQEQSGRYQEAIRVNIKQKLMRNMKNCNERLADQISFISDDIETAVDNYMERILRDDDENDDASSIAPSIVLDSPTVNESLNLDGGHTRVTYRTSPLSNGATSSLFRYSRSMYEQNENFNDERFQRPSSRQTRREPLRDSSDADTQWKRRFRARTPVRGLRSDQHSQAGSYRNNHRVTTSETSDNESVGNRSVRSATSSWSCYNPRQPGLFVISQSDRLLPINIVGWHGVYMRNLDTNISSETVQEVFSAFGKVFHCEVRKWDRNTAAYVHYDNSRSPAKAIHVFQGINDSRLSYKQTRLVMRFTNGHNQDRRLIKVGRLATRLWTSNECFHWRTNGCDRSIRKCIKDHKPMCRGIDYQPWML